MPDLKVVLITGASSGIGAAAAEACATAGFRVALAARRLDRLQQLAAKINRPEATLILPADLRDPAAIQRMTTETLKHFGRIDVLLANSGVGHSEAVVDLSEEHLLDQVEVNLLGVIRCARAVLPGMIERRSGHIITISSVAAEMASPRGAVYAATKGGVNAFSEGLRREVQSQGIQVTTVQPGFIRTEMTAQVNYPMPPATVMGDLILQLIRRPRRRAVFPRYYGGAIWLNRFCPSLIDLAIRQMLKRLEWRR